MGDDYMDVLMKHGFYFFKNQVCKKCGRLIAADLQLIPAESFDKYKKNPKLICTHCNNEQEAEPERIFKPGYSREKEEFFKKLINSDGLELKKSLAIPEEWKYYMTVNDDDDRQFVVN